MVGWYHRLNGHGFGWTPGVGNIQGGLVCCASWGHKESDTTELMTEKMCNLKVENYTLFGGHSEDLSLRHRFSDSSEGQF